jgi:5-aminolevulinate synthase
LRLTPTPQHSNTDMDHLVNSLSELWAECPVSKLPVADKEAAE